MNPEFVNQFAEDKRVWALSAYVNASRVLIRAKTIETLISGFCDGITNQQPYVLACVGLNEPLPSKNISIVGKSASAIGYVENLNLSWDENSPFGEGPTGIAIRTKQPVILDNNEQATNYSAWIEKTKPYQIHSSIAIPIYDEESVYGALNVYASNTNAFGEAEKELFSILSEELAYGIKNIRRIQQLDSELSKKELHQKELLQSFETAVFALATALEFRDPYTAGHQRKVAEISVAIAKELGLEGNQLEAIKLAAIVHDIGKISVPIEYLTKPTKLTPLELAVIREHAEKGYEILKDIPFSLPIADIARQHHERINGSGYPLGLKGDEILLEAKIIAVADVIESMATNRPYRFSPGLEKSIEEITQNAGILYDKDVANAVKSLHERKYFESFISPKLLFD